MSRENDFYARMIADATLVAILTGGVWKKETTGLEGITRETAAAAFDVAGYLRPTALVRQRDIVPDGAVRDPMAQKASTSVVIEIWLYEDRGYTNIDAAMSRLFTLFEGYQFSDSFEVQWVNTVDRLRDMGSLKGASLARMDWQVSSVRG